MIIVAFGYQQQEFCRICVAYGQPVAVSGDGSWLDFTFRPYSERLNRSVGWEEDCEEWTRSLVYAYRHSKVKGALITDTADMPTPGAFASAPIYAPLSEYAPPPGYQPPPPGYQPPPPGYQPPPPGYQPPPPGYQPPPLPHQLPVPGYQPPLPNQPPTRDWAPPNH